MRGSRHERGQGRDGDFLNSAGFGAYPEMLANGERLRGWLGRWPATSGSRSRTCRSRAPGEPFEGPGEFVIGKRPQRLAIYAPHRSGDSDAVDR